MNNVESDIAQVFESWGFQCIRIKEGSDKRPDFFLSDEHERYYVELKTKYESPERSRIRQDSLRSGRSTWIRWVFTLLQHIAQF